VNNVVGPLALPAWTPGLVIVLLGVAFPIALVVAWAFEMTPDGVRRSEPPVGGSSLAPFARTDLILVAALVSVLGVELYQVVRQPLPTRARDTATRSAGGAAPRAEPSIAVLAFSDLSPKGDQGYFASGVSEEILNVLTRIDGLEAASRTSSFSYSGQEEIGAPVIAEELSVRKAGDRLRITAQLIDAQADRHIWSKTFDRTLTTDDIFAIQDDIANAIVDAMRATMGLDAPPAIERRADTQNLDDIPRWRRAANPWELHSF
jgi:TolB-like protein